MKAPAINNVIHQAKAVKPGTPRSVIDRVMTDLIGCVEYLSEELKIKPKSEFFLVTGFEKIFVSQFSAGKANCIDD